MIVERAGISMSKASKKGSTRGGKSDLRSADRLMDTAQTERERVRNINRNARVRDRSLLARFEPGRKLFLAVPYSIFVSTLNEPIARPVLEDLAVACLAFDPHQEVIVTWTT